MTSSSTMLASFFNLQPMELLILGALLLLIFGSRLPEVGKSLGRGIVEFKKGLKGIDEEVDHSARGTANPHAAQQQGQWAPPPPYPQQASALPPGTPAYPPYPAQAPHAYAQAAPQPGAQGAAGPGVAPGQPHA